MQENLYFRILRVLKWCSELVTVNQFCIWQNTVTFAIILVIKGDISRFLLNDIEMSGVIYWQKHSQWIFEYFLGKAIKCRRSKLQNLAKIFSISRVQKLAWKLTLGTHVRWKAHVRLKAHMRWKAHVHDSAHVSSWSLSSSCLLWQQIKPGSRWQNSGHTVWVLFTLKFYVSSIIFQSVLVKEAGLTL